MTQASEPSQPSEPSAAAERADAERADAPKVARSAPALVPAAAAALAQHPDLRIATRADNNALCELFRQTAMEADLTLAVERDPDFFALYDLQEGSGLTFVLEHEGALESMGTFLVRECWLAGRKARVGYAGDLRVATSRRGAGFVTRGLPAVFEASAAQLDFDVALTTIIATNRAAKAALVARSSKHPHKPLYQLLRPFTILSVHLVGRRRARGSAYRVERATDAEVGEVAAFLAADHATRPFGYVIDESVLLERIARWPGLRAESFFLARDGAGRLCGVVAPWDAHEVKRFRVLAYRRRMRWVKRAFGVAAWLKGFPPLPPEGGVFRDAYLTHVSIAGDDPAILGALLEAVYAEYASTGHHFLTACVLEGDPLAPAYRPYWSTGLAAELYAVTRPESPLASASWTRERPGFEMALV